MSTDAEQGNQQSEGKGRGRSPLQTIAIVALFLGLVCVYPAIVANDDQSEDVGEVEEVTVRQVYNAYLDNVVRANATYKDRSLRVEFRVDAIEEQGVVQRIDDVAGMYAALLFSEEKLIAFNRGEVGTAICRFGGLETVDNSWLVFDCR